MGDADNDTQGIVQEFETWMNETTDIVEEGLNNIISLAMELEQRTKRVQSEYKTLASLKRFFFAFNVMVLPVVLALLLCYMVRDVTDETVNEVQKNVQPVISFLMFLSGAIGVPCYVYSIFEHVCEDPENQEKLLRLRRLLLPWFLSDASFSSFPANHFSEERLDELVRVLRHRIPDAIRSGVEFRTMMTEANLSPARNSPRYELRRLSSEVLRELDPLNSPKTEKTENKVEKIETKEKTDAFPVLYKLQLRGNDLNPPDLAVKTEPKGIWSTPEPPAPKLFGSVGNTVVFRPVPAVVEIPQTEPFENPYRRDYTENMTF